MAICRNSISKWSVCLDHKLHLMKYVCLKVFLLPIKYTLINMKIKI